MKYRTLKNGQKVAEANKSVRMTIDSKCPKKWAFVDMETGDVWVHKSRTNTKRVLTGDFYSADEKALKCLKELFGEKPKKLIFSEKLEWDQLM